MTTARERHLKKVKDDREKGLADLDEAQLKKRLNLRITRPYEGKKPDPRFWTTAERKEVAAHLDSDGCLSIGFDKRSETYHVVFDFTGASKLPLLLAESYSRGTAFLNENSGKFTWRIGRQKELTAMLKAIKPHVRLKAEHVDVALKALKILKKKPRGWKAKLAGLKEEMGRLNDLEDRKRRGLEYWEATDPRGSR